MSLEAITRMMNTFKHFDKKLDKLQDDVNYQGQTLLDLRVMVMNLSAGNIVSPDAKSEEEKRPRNTTTAVQHEDKEKSHRTPTAERLSTQSGLKSLPTKIKTHHKRRLSSLDTPNEIQIHKMEVSQVHMQRHKKADASRKGNTKHHHKKKTEAIKPSTAATE